MNFQHDKVEIIEKFQRICLDKYEDILVLDRKAYQENLGDANQNKLTKIYSGYQSKAPIGYLSDLINNPRDLKLVLRKTDFLWQKLHGEIDFNDLLVVNAIWISVPPVFEFLLANLDKIRSLGSSENSSATMQGLQDELKDISKRVDVNGVVIEELVTYLFPYWDSNKSRTLKETCQNVRISEPTDYFERLLSGEVLEGELSDQKALRLFKGWKENDDKLLSGKSLGALLLYDDGLCQKYIHMENYFYEFDSHDILDVASETVAEIVKSESPLDELFLSPVILGLAGLFEGRSFSEVKFNAWCKSEIQCYVDRGITLLINLYDKFFGIHIRKYNNQKGFFREVQGILQSHLEALSYYKGDKLPEFFYSNNDDALLNFCQKYSLSGRQFDPNEWKWLSPYLIQAARSDPKRITPLIIFLLSDKQRFHSGAASTMFSDEIISLARLIEEVEIECVDENQHRLIHQAIQFAGGIGN